MHSPQCCCLYGSPLDKIQHLGMLSFAKQAPTCVANVVASPPSLQAVIEYMRSYSHTEEHFTYISGSVYWTGAYVLSDLLLTEGAEGGGALLQTYSL